MTEFDEYDKIRSKLIKAKRIIPEGKYNVKEYEKRKNVKELSEDEIIDSNYIPITSHQIKQFGLDNLIFRGDTVRYMLKKHTRNNPTDKDVIRRGGFVKTIHLDDPEFPPYFTLTTNKTSWIIKIDELKKIYVKPLGRRRPEQLKCLLKGIEYVDPIIERKNKLKAEKEQQKLMKKQTGGEKYYKKDVDIPKDICDKLDDLYYNQHNFVGRHRLFELCKEQKINATQRMVGKYLKMQTVNQVHQQVKPTVIVKPLLAKGPNKHLQCDFIEEIIPDEKIITAKYVEEIDYPAKNLRKTKRVNYKK